MRPNVRPASSRGAAPLRHHCLLADPSDPVIREFIRGELLRGTIRTAPAGPDRLLILPIGESPVLDRVSPASP